MNTENKTTIKVSRVMSDKVYDKITGCQAVGWISFIVGVLCLPIGLFNGNITTMVIGCVCLGNALTFSFLIGHFKALYPMVKSAENQIAIDNEKYEFVRNADVDTTK